MKIHELKLATTPFESIKSGGKIIESRLFDERRKEIEIGDELRFINRDHPQSIIRAKVIDLMRYRSFEEMFKDNNPSDFGGESVDWLMKQIREFYSPEDEMKDGVLGILFKLLN
ncbi:MAG: ASCH domain-containing protein [Candidatus Levybacteria bacterium]|nr:ASCH domain-containing protein [Candidatus Levybacteria bacterium]